MPESYYHEALKLGQKEVHARKAQGESPYLKVLEEELQGQPKPRERDLGVFSVPAEFIAGTKDSGRMNAFAANFMPLLPEDSEFAIKWEALCRAHLSEGIRDPVKAYEYLGRYYVEEGNKRVSVLRFFGASSIPAQVIRLLPEKTNDPARLAYYAWVDFVDLSGVRFLMCTSPDSYEKLQRLVGKAPGEAWSGDETRHFSAGYHNFRSALAAFPEENSDPVRAGDALIAYLEIYGYESLFTEGAAGLKTNLKRMREELTVRRAEDPVELKLTPDPEKRQGFFAGLLSSAPQPLKCAFLYVNPPESSGWSAGHEAGRIHLERVLEGKVTTKAYVGTSLDQAIEDGNHVIFTTSPRMLPDSLRAAIEHPDRRILNCSLNTSHRYIRTYYARMYEAKFIIGALAGSLSETGRIGYVCDYPIAGQIAGINAFALGAQMTNPRAKIVLEWLSVKDGDQAVERLLDQEIQLISSQDQRRYSRGAGSSFGLYRVTRAGEVPLAAPVWKWGVYYERLLRLILSRAEEDAYASSEKAINYYWGMSAGVVDVACAKQIPEASWKLVRFLKSTLEREAATPFMAPFFTQSGRAVGREGELLTQEEIVNMDYLAENVLGRIPAYDDLTPAAQETVDIMGAKIL